MKTLTLCALLFAASTNVTATAAVKLDKQELIQKVNQQPHRELGQETFITIDLVQVDDSIICRSADTLLQQPHSTAAPDVLIGIMLAAKQSGLAIEQVEEESCYNR